MAYQTSDFFFKNLATQGQAVLNTLKHKGQQFANQPKTKQGVIDAFNQKNVAAIGNQKLNNSPFSLTRDQRSANIKYGTAPDARTEALASQSVGRGLSKQQAPRNGQKPLAPDEFYDAGGVVRKKMSVGNWKSQQQFQTGQYGGFSGNFQHFANFGIGGAAKIGSLVGLGAGLAK